MANRKKIAFVDLEQTRIETLQIPQRLRRNYLGGPGLAAYLMCIHTEWKSADQTADAPLVISAGWLCGTLTSPLGPAVVSTRSPVSGQLEKAIIDGRFAAEMRRAGFDHLVLKGRAAGPVFLFVQDGVVDIQGAGNIGEGNALDTIALIRTQVGAGAIMAFGIVNRHGQGHSQAATASDSGSFSGGNRLVAAFGARNINAVACRGKMDIEVRFPEQVLAYEQTEPRGRVESAPDRLEGTPPYQGPAGQVSYRILGNHIAQSLGVPFDTLHPHQSGTQALSLEPASERIRLNTGVRMSASQLWEAAYRGYMLERLYNLKTGVVEPEARAGGWTRKKMVRKKAVFQQLDMVELWPMFR
jgi:aldehyde:ferredoxin oxidoreductase